MICVGTVQQPPDNQPNSFSERRHRRSPCHAVLSEQLLLRQLQIGV